MRPTSASWAASGCNDENYSHGFLVVPIAVFILWRRLTEVPREEESGQVGSAPLWGWLFLVAALVVRAVAYERSYQWVETATILPAIIGLTWAFGGWPLLYRAWPAILFLVFMLPLPISVNGLIALPLQRLAATGSYFLLQLSGFWVVQQGNVLHLTTPFGTRPLDVALACSGLKMLMTLAATVTATIMLLPLPTWKRLVLLASAVPIALISNITRIVTTGWCYYFIKGETGKHWAHDISGWMMMPLALVLVWARAAGPVLADPQGDRGRGGRSQVVALAAHGSGPRRRRQTPRIRRMNGTLFMPAATPIPPAPHLLAPRPSRSTSAPAPPGPAGGPHEPGPGPPR